MVYQDSFDPDAFVEDLDTTLEKVKLILKANRTLAKVDDVDHKYEDKYLLATALVNSANCATVAALNQLGINELQLKQIVEWSKERDVSLRFEGTESCEFSKEVKRQVEDPRSSETTIKGAFGMSITNKSYTTITEYIYKFTAQYKLIAFRGVGERDSDVIVLKARTASQELVLRSKECPYPAVRQVPNIDVNISWLLRHPSPTFTVDRSDVNCCTPFRNKDVSEAMRFYSVFYDWAYEVDRYLSDSLLQVEYRHEVPVGTVHVDRDVLDADDLFIPVFPLFEERTEEEPVTSTALTTVSSPTANLDDQTVTAILGEGERALEAKLAKVEKAYPDPAKGFISHAEGKLLLTTRYIGRIAVTLQHSLEYIEHLLHQQLVKAIGKELQPADMSEYMKFHNRRLFSAQYQPVPFSYSVRRTATHSPEGILRIEETVPTSGGVLYEPIPTITNHQVESESAPMQFQLSASTKVTIGGDRYVHGVLLHQFQNDNGTASSPSLQIVCEARQFSSYIVLLGQIASATLFEPKFAMIVQNKDEIKIPLNLETIPTPKEFKDAIQSLSPTQQRFAQAFRSMQLQSTLFGVCLIQIKPQLETVLKLSADSLTKEIRLTQDLMELFITYQIPTDLLNYDETTWAGADAGTRLTAVKHNVAAIQSMLNESKEREIKEKRQEHQFLQPELYAKDAYDYDDECEERCVPSPPVYKKMAKSKAMPSAPRSSSFMMMSAPPMPAPCSAPMPPPSASAGPSFGASNMAMKESAQVSRRLDAALPPAPTVAPVTATNTTGY